VQDKASENGAEWAALGKAFVLEEGVDGAIGLEEEAMVGVTIKKVKERENRVEGRVGGKAVAGSFAGDGVEHVGDVE
jgi:hypothetical protein